VISTAPSPESAVLLAVISVALTAGFDVVVVPVREVLLCWFIPLSILPLSPLYAVTSAPFFAAPAYLYCFTALTIRKNTTLSTAQYICATVFTVLSVDTILLDSVFTEIMDTRTKRVWNGLVNYANGTATNAQLRSTVADCMGWVSAIAPFGLLLGWMNDHELAIQAAEYRPAVDRLLRFLCSGPNSEERKSLRSQAKRFLNEHGQHIGGINLVEVSYNEKSLQNFNYTPAELKRFKEQSDRIWESAQYRRRGEDRLTGTNMLPLGIYVPTKDYQDLADPICDFLMSEYQKYLDKYLEYSRRDKEPAPVVPIFVCPRCNKLVMPERTGRKQYCSDCTDQARTEKYRQKAPAGEGRDYQWLYRLSKKDTGSRKVFLRNQKNQARLREVKSRQEESSRCQGLLLDMRL
jgi:hypothetical protein